MVTFKIRVNGAPLAGYFSGETTGLESAHREFTKRIHHGKEGDCVELVAYDGDTKIVLVKKGHRMTKDEALEKMKQGFKVRQKHFTSGEFLYMKNDVVMSEDGYNFNDWFFNITPATQWKLEGWSVYNE